MDWILQRAERSAPEPASMIDAVLPCPIAVVSDLHLGTRSRIDLLADDGVRQLLTRHLARAETLVLLGDAVELRDRPAAETLARIAPVLRDLGEAMSGRPIVFVPGNHDHEVARSALAAAGRWPPRTPYERADPRSGDLLADLAALLRPARLVLRYPAVTLGTDVVAMHGHHLDVHSAAPTFECAASAVLGVLRPGGPPATPPDYERLLEPTYRLFWAVAQRRSLRRPADRGKALVARAEAALGTRGPAAARPGDTALRRPALPRRLPVVAGEHRRPGLLPFGRVVTELGIEASTVLFGHTHRTGTDGSPTAPSGVSLVNTGSWVYEPHYAGGDPASPYWPGTVTWIEADGAVVQHRLLASPAAADELARTMRRR